MGRNCYEDWTTLDAEREVLPIIREKISICRRAHPSEYGIRKYSTNVENGVTLHCNFCRCRGRSGTAGMGRGRSA